MQYLARYVHDSNAVYLRSIGLHTADLRMGVSKVGDPVKNQKSTAVFDSSGSPAFAGDVLKSILNYSRQNTMS